MLFYVLQGSEILNLLCPLRGGEESLVINSELTNQSEQKALFAWEELVWYILIAQFRYIKIQPKTIDLSTRLVGITTEFVRFIPTSLVLRSIVLG